MDDTKRLQGYEVNAVDPQGAHVTLTLKSEGGRRDTFTASDEVFAGLVRFVLDIDLGLQRRRDGAGPRASEAGDLLRPRERIDLVLDLTGSCALLRVETSLGRTIQLELSEEVLARLEERLPGILAQLRARRAGQPN